MLSGLVYWVHFSFLGFIIWLLFQKSRNQPLIRYFFPALLIKLCSGVALGMLYVWYFNGGDTLNYFHDATILASMATESLADYIGAIFTNDNLPSGLIYATQPRALLFSKVVSFFALLTFNNYWLTALYLSLLSFLGIWYLANQVVKLFPNTAKAAAFAFLFFPSFVFWSSGVMKESLAMPALCVLVGYTLGFISNLSRHGLGSPHSKVDTPACGTQDGTKSGRSVCHKLGKGFSRGLGSPRSRERVKSLFTIFFIAVLLWLLWQLKYYYFGALVPVLATTLLVALAGRKKFITSSFSKILLWLVIFSGLLAMGSFVHPNLRFENFAAALVRNHDIIYKASSPENLVHYNALTPTWTSLLQNAPKALFAGLYRPTVWEMHTPFHAFLAVENLVLLFLTFLAIFQRIWYKRKESNQSELLFATLVYVTLLATLLALASPNFGSLARYRVGFLPFFAYLVFGGVNLKKLSTFFPKE